MLLASGDGGPTLISAITTAGLTGNLQLCLDSGDGSSYTSGTKWLDVAGSGYDFFLGSDGTSSNDPTFVGAGGWRQSYWSFNGSQYFTYDTTNETWMQNLHKNNAALTILAISYATTVNGGICGTGQGANNRIGITFTDSPSFLVGNNSGTYALTAFADSTSTTNTWHMIAVSLNEATGASGGFFYRDGGYAQVSSSDTWNSTYTSPSVSSASSTMQIAAMGSAIGPIVSGGRLACIAIWNTFLTKANLDSIWSLMRGRFGI
jgi:hypothetical protein